MGIPWDDVVVIQHGKESNEPSVVTVNCPDKAGLGCDLCRIILQFGLRITRADISTDGRWCYIVFWVVPHPPSLKVDWESLKTRLLSACPSCLFSYHFNQQSTTPSPPPIYLLKVWIIDHKGLLHDINEILCNLQLSIERVKVMPTPDGRALDLFFITDGMELLHTKKRQDYVCEYLKEALGEKCISSEIQLAGPEYGHLQGFASLPPAYSEELFGPELVDKVSLHPLSQDMTTLKKPSVMVDNSLSQVHTLLQIQCVDQKGLCYDIMRISKDSDIKELVRVIRPQILIYVVKENPSFCVYCRVVSGTQLFSSLSSSPDISSDHIFNGDDESMVMKNNEKKDNETLTMNQDNENSLVLNDSSICESDDGYQSYTSLSKLEKLSIGSKPPKDFVCPITGQIFCDPVTLETGQTYERKAVQEWLRTGNTTCPITRQPLSAIALPKTNYVLKRLITSWKEQNPELAQEFSNSNTPRGSSCSPSAKDITMLSTTQRTSDSPNQKNKENYMRQRSNRCMQVAATTSPTSVLSQAAVETIMNSLKPYISSLCTSENLHECEEAVLEIARLWKDSKTDPQIHSYLSKPTVISGLVEILSASVNREILRTSIYILSELVFVDESVGETLNSVDSDFDCLATLLKNGLAEAALLIYQLRPAFSQISAHELIPSLIQVIQNKNEEIDNFQLVIDPRDAAIAILEQILMGGDEYNRSVNASSVISANGISALAKYLEKVEGRRPVVSIFLCCMQAEKSCKSSIAKSIELSPVLELLHAGNDSVRGICVEFLSELVRLNSNQILLIIKDEGAFSTMHTFLVYLQMAPMEHQIAVASLLQLDLLVEPRKMSIYREESVETLIEALWQKDFSNTQMKALDALLFLIGQVNSSGKSYTEAWLLKIAGFGQPYNALMKAEQLGPYDNDLMETMEDEQNAMKSWQKRVAFVLCNHENGSIFQALEECLKSNSLKLAKYCLVLATWLTHMLSTLPDTCVREVARKSLLEELINVIQSSKNLEEKILATLALKTFINHPTAHEALRVYAKSIYRILRKLRKYSVVAVDIMKALLNLNSVDVMSGIVI